jgi:hypothetical protein
MTQSSRPPPAAATCPPTCIETNLHCHLLTFVLDHRPSLLSRRAARMMTRTQGPHQLLRPALLPAMKQTRTATCCLRFHRRPALLSRPVARMTTRSPLPTCCTKPNTATNTAFVPNRRPSPLSHQASAKMTRSPRPPPAVVTTKRRATA